MSDSTPAGDPPPPSSRARPQVWRVPTDARQQPVERAIERRFPTWSQGHIAKLLRQDRVLVEGQPVVRGHRLSGGERLEVLPPPEKPRTYLPNRRIRPTFLHQDSHLVAVAKPAGLAMHPGPGHGSDTLLNGLLATHGAALRTLGEARGYGLVHRLDRDTSGVVLVALTEAAYDSLRDQFTRRLVVKAYLGLVSGQPRDSRLTLTTRVEGREATTEVTVLERFGDCTLLELQPRTGRTHQLRVQLAAAGHPVVGDLRYGPRRPPDHPLRRLGVGRMFLHAARVTCTHPATGEQLTIEARPPRDLRRALSRLRRRAAGPGRPGAPGP
jgi:23S rRNA pseudouridine1911/1915/1917 synthase